MFQHTPTAETVRRSALFIATMLHVTPQRDHQGAAFGGALGPEGASGRVMEDDESLLLLANELLMNDAFTWHRPLSLFRKQLFSEAPRHMDHARWILQQQLLCFHVVVNKNGGHQWETYVLYDLFKVGSLPTLFLGFGPFNYGRKHILLFCIARNQFQDLF